MSRTLRSSFCLSVAHFVPKTFAIVLIADYWKMGSIWAAHFSAMDSPNFERAFSNLANA